MNINYEMLTYILFFVCAFGFAYLISLTKSVKHLSAQVIDLSVQLERAKNTICTDVARANADTIANHHYLVDISDAVTDIHNELFNEDEDDEDCEWTPEDEEDAVKEEHTVTIEIDELPIHLITPNQYFFESGYDKFELEYNSVNDTLSDDTYLSSPPPQETNITENAAISANNIEIFFI